MHDDSTHSTMHDDSTHSTMHDDSTPIRGYVVLDLSQSVLYDDYDISLTVHNYTGDVLVFTSRHVAAPHLSHP